MPHHVWGDGFDFDQLWEAGNWISRFYKLATGNTLHWKEKYGTIRYEYMFLSFKKDTDFPIFCEILKRSTRKYPDIASEIVSDIVPSIWEEAITARYYLGYFEGILAANKQYWKSTKPYKHWKFRNE